VIVRVVLGWSGAPDQVFSDRPPSTPSRDQPWEVSHKLRTGQHRSQARSKCSSVSLKIGVRTVKDKPRPTRRWRCFRPPADGLRPGRRSVGPVHEQEIHGLRGRKGGWLPDQLSIVAGRRCLTEDAAGDDQVSREDHDPHSARCGGAEAAVGDSRDGRGGAGGCAVGCGIPLPVPFPWTTGLPCVGAWGCPLPVPLPPP
jgi:hypothetical protein